MSKALEIKYCNDCPFVEFHHERPSDPDYDMVKITCKHPEGQGTSVERKVGRSYDPYPTCPLPDYPNDYFEY